MSLFTSMAKKKTIDQSIINFNEKRLTLYDQKLSVAMFFFRRFHGNIMMKMLHKKKFRIEYEL